MGQLGKRLVVALLKEKNLSVLSELGVTEANLIKDGREAFDWATKWVRVKGEWPTPEMVMENTGISLPVDTTDSLSYITDLVRQRALGWALQNELKRSAEQIEARDPDEALRMMLAAVLKLQQQGNYSKVVSHRASGKDRVKSYEEMKEVRGLLGIPTPWETLNYQIQGWVDGCLHVITALQNTGKSWGACIIADHAFFLGHTILFVTMEMAVPRIQRRLDSLRYKIPFKEMRDARVTTEDAYLSALDRDVEGKGDIILADKAMVKRVSDVTALVLEHKPDLVIIDGGYRLEGVGKGRWESTVNIVNELQLSAETTNIPWVVTTQQGDANETGKEKKRGPKMRAWNVRYGKEWVIDPDVVIGMHQDADLRLIDSMEIYPLKIRDGVAEIKRDFFRIYWNMTDMVFTEPVKETEKEGDIGGEHEVTF